ncbi:Hsp70 family protein [Bifidobacterium sp. ESL0820]|uniref:Hsp70 family protein n=1 Tax=Bifidobacterium sp. ESL0820 TaxID=3448586 RepID=UPI004042E7DA
MQKGKNETGGRHRFRHHVFSSGHSFSGGGGLVLKTPEGESSTPSVVYFPHTDGQDKPTVGTVAKHMAAADPDNVVQFVKRHMGEPNWRYDSPAGQSYSPEEISAIILKHLKQDAETNLGKEITDAVITVPAYFDDARRTATKQAGKIAGFNVLRVLNEPTAAAISYGLDSQKKGTILVYDLGGGTFDVTLLSVEDLTFEVIGTDGDRNLGGFDFDNALMKLIAAKVSDQGGEGLLDDFQATADLREKAEIAKRALSKFSTTNVFITFKGKNYKIAITREEFEQATQSLLARTRDLVQDVMDEADFDWNDIDYVLLVGGSTRMPMVHRMMEKLTGKEPQSDVNPDEAVAKGAAVQAGLEESKLLEAEGKDPAAEGLPTLGGAVQIQDVASQSLGVLAANDDTDGLHNSIVIPRNSAIPGSYSNVFYTMQENQECVKVEVTQGDDEDPRFVTIIGTSTLNLPPHPENSPLKITYYYDIDQTVQIEVVDLVTNQSLGSFEIDRVANLGKQEMADSANKLNTLSID